MVCWKDVIQTIKEENEKSYPSDVLVPSPTCPLGVPDLAQSEGTGKDGTSSGRGDELKEFKVYD